MKPGDITRAEAAKKIKNLFSRISPSTSQFIRTSVYWIYLSSRVETD